MGVYINGITVQMLRNAPLEAVEELLASGDMIEVPEPHGRLIDAKVALEEIDKEDGGPCYEAEQGLANTPTVIEAEGEQDECIH